MKMQPLIAKSHAEPGVLDRESPVYLRVLMHGLVCACPVEGGNPASCQLFAWRQRSMRERIEWVKRLSDAERLAFVQQHNRCAFQLECRGRHAGLALTLQTDLAP